MSTQATIYYKAVKHKSPVQDAELWYPSIVRRAGQVYNIEKLSAHMSEHNTPYATGVVQAVITDMVSCMIELIKEGRSITIDNLGTFRPTIATKETAEKADDVTADNISRLRIKVRTSGVCATKNFKPNVSFKKVQ